VSLPAKLIYSEFRNFSFKSERKNSNNSGRSKKLEGILDNMNMKEIEHEFEEGELNPDDEEIAQKVKSQEYLNQLNCSQQLKMRILTQNSKPQGILKVK